MLLEYKYRILRSVLPLCLVFSMLLPVSASAQMLESIDIERADGMAVIKITLSHNIRYRGHFPQDRGSILNIYFDNVALEDSGFQNPNPNPNLKSNPMNPGAPMSNTGSHDMPDEYLRSPPSDLIPFFWVAHLHTTAGDAGLGGYYLSVQFSETENFSVRADEDNRAFYIYVPITQHQNKASAPAAAAPMKADTTPAPVAPNSPPATTSSPVPSRINGSGVAPTAMPIPVPSAPASGDAL